MEEKERLKKIKYEKKKEEKKKEKVSCKYIKVKVILKYECKCSIIFLIDPLRSTLLVFEKIIMRTEGRKIKKQSLFK